MFSEACVILFTINLITTSVTAHLCYGAVGTHPTGMLSCVNLFLNYQNDGIFTLSWLLFRNYFLKKEKSNMRNVPTCVIFLCYFLNRIYFLLKVTFLL